VISEKKPNAEFAERAEDAEVRSRDSVLCVLGVLCVLRVRLFRPNHTYSSPGAESSVSSAPSAVKAVGLYTSISCALASIPSNSDASSSVSAVISERTRSSSLTSRAIAAS
jgi:hypothetical protein